VASSASQLYAAHQYAVEDNCGHCGEHFQFHVTKASGAET